MGLPLGEGEGVDDGDSLGDGLGVGLGVEEGVGVGLSVTLGDGVLLAGGYLRPNKTKLFNVASNQLVSAIVV